MFYLRYLYLFAYIDVQHIFCCDWFCLSSFCVKYVPYVTSFSGLSFLIAPSVFSNVYLYIYVMSKLRTVFASSPNMILLLDTNGK
jgi:hypothetical protein